jgi:hypothetical protein
MRHGLAVLRVGHGRAPVFDTPRSARVDAKMMYRRKRRALSWVGSVVLAALLLVPLTLAGHHHDGDAASRACATCVVMQHSPAVQAPPLRFDAPAFRTFSFRASAPRVVARLSASPAHGRAPPSAPSRAA